MGTIWFVLLAFGTFFVAEGAIPGTSTYRVVCKNDTQCGVGECCYIQPEFLIMSRRRSVHQPVHLLPPAHTKHDTGYCEKYHAVNDPCNNFEKANGHCGCPAGTGCQFIPDSTPVMPTGPIIKRMPPLHPGIFRCLP